MDMTDEELARGIGQKNEKALDCLIDRYGGLIKSIVSYHLKEEYRGECINDVLFSVWNNISSFNPAKNSLKNWIGAVCKYKCIDYKRKYYRESFAQIDENIPSPLDAESAVLKRETEEEINELLSSLAQSDREIFRRRYIDDESIEEISRGMNITSSVLYNRLSRGRRKIKNSLLRSGHNEK